MGFDRIARVLALALALAGAGCGGEPADADAVPDAPVQGGEALQVEVDPAGTDTPTTGTPGAATQPPDSL